MPPVLAHDKAELARLDPVRRFGEHRLGSPHEHRVVFVVVDDLAMPGLLGDRETQIATSRTGP